MTRTPSEPRSTPSPAAAATPRKAGSPADLEKLVAERKAAGLPMPRLVRVTLDGEVLWDASWPKPDELRIVWWGRDTD